MDTPDIIRHNDVEVKGIGLAVEEAAPTGCEFQVVEPCPIHSLIRWLTPVHFVGLGLFHRANESGGAMIRIAYTWTRKDAMRL